MFKTKKYNADIKEQINKIINVSENTELFVIIIFLLKIGCEKSFNILRHYVLKYWMIFQW